MSTFQEDQLVCFCHHVTAGTIKSAIEAGARTLEAVQAQTCASTGCGGCEWEVRQMLEDQLASELVGASAELAQKKG